MSTRNISLERVAGIVLFITVLLSPVFFVPSLSIGADTGKTLLLAAGVLASFSLYLIALVKKGEFGFPQTRVLWAALLIPAAFFASALLSGDAKVSLFGYGLEVGTWAFVTLGFVLMFLVAALGTKKRAFYSYLGFFAGFAIIALFTLVKFFAPSSLAFGGIFSSQFVTPVGTWTDTAVFFGAASVILLMAIESLSLSVRSRAVAWISLLASVFILAVLDIPVVWIGLLIFSLVYLLYAYSANAGAEPANAPNERKISYGALILLLVSLLFVFAPSVSSGGGLGSVLSQKFGVSNVEVSPSLSATYQATRPVLRENPIFGSGPNTFDTDWNAHKPAAVNGSIFWSAPFSYGSGLLTTFVATTGILGSLAWLLFLVSYVLLGVRAVFAKNADRIGAFLTNASFVSSLFLWLIFFATVPSKAVFVLAFALSGLFISSATASGIIARRTILFRNSSKLAFVAVLLLVAALVGNVAYAYATIRQSAAEVYFNKASIAANASDAEGARTYVMKAAALTGGDIYYGALAQIDVARANAILNDASSTPANAQAKFQAALSETISASQAAVSARPSSYANQIALGQLYESLVPAPLSVKGAYDSAKAAYEQAKLLNPQSPEPYYLEARLEVENKNDDGARALIEQALAKKNDYDNAYYLLSQIEISEKNTAEAIKNTETLAVLDPQNAGVFFQLGILKYTAADYQGASDALAQALVLSPGYANAMYYQGLALYKLGQKDAALAEFQALAKANPDNTILPAVIANLNAGKDPLYKLDTGSAETTPPISGASQNTAQ